MAKGRFVLHTNQFGCDMYVSEDYVMTDKIEEALVFEHGRDNPEIKTKYWQGVTSYDLKAVDI